MRCPEGFTSWRWMYWLKRLHEIRDEAHAAKKEHMEELAGDSVDSLTITVKDRNSEILRAYERGGADLHQDPHLLSLATKEVENPQS